MTVPFDPGVLRNDPEHRALILDLFTGALDEVDPYRAVARRLRLVDGTVTIDGVAMTNTDRIIVLAFGKAAPSMARAVADILPLDTGLVISNHPEPLPPPLELVPAGHPLPDDRSVAGARRLLRLGSEATAGDLVLCLISGGGSALAEIPAPDLTLSDLQETVRLLLTSGAPIEEINTVRTHLSAFKGGRLAQAVAPARLVTLVLSDIVDSPIPFIASGPTVADPTTYADALDILERYELTHLVPPRVLRHLRLGADGVIAETPKTDLPDHRVVIVADGATAAEGARRVAKRIGLSATIATTTLTGEAREAAVACIGGAGTGITIFAGETTVTVRGGGLGGRNQEAALAAATVIETNPDIVFATLATDGVDGPTDAAGAIVDGSTLSRGRALGLDAAAALESNDAYPYLQATADLLMTGPTGTNVGDLWVVWRW